jgi:hypothetical protein
MLTWSNSAYATFFPNTTDYPLGDNPTSWSLVPAMRHAMALYPHTPYIFYLTSTALIMNPSLSIEEHIMEPRRLESLMLVDKPVVPPDSVIKTFSHLKGDRIDFVLSQDNEGLAGGSMVIRAGEWAKFFLDSWFDPLYRSYNFQKAEAHALEHIVQCVHPESSKVFLEHTLTELLQMARHDPSQASTRTPTHPELVYTRPSRGYLQRRRFRRKLPRLHPRPEAQLRSRNATTPY